MKYSTIRRNPNYQCKRLNVPLDYYTEEEYREMRTRVLTIGCEDNDYKGFLSK